MRSLTISDVRTTVVGTPWRELVFVELETDEGLTGLSEVRMVNRTDTLLACLHELAPRHVIGTDPFDVERLAWKIQRVGLQPSWRGHAVGAGGVRHRVLGSQGTGARCSGLEAARRPVPRPRAAYANGWYQSERDPAAIGLLARGVVERGYRALKLDPFGAASAELRRSRSAAPSTSSRPFARRSAPTCRS